MNRMKGLVVLGVLTSLALPQSATATRLPAANEEVARTSAVARNGKIAYMKNRRGNVDVFAVNPSGMTPVNLTKSRADEGYVEWSPDGRRLVFTRFGRGAGDLFTISRRGTAVRRLTSGRAADEAPRSSPDGRAVAFDRTVGDEQAEVFVVDARGTNVTRLTRNSLGDHVGGWSPDGAKLVIYRGVLDNEQYDIHSDESIRVRSVMGAASVTCTSRPIARTSAQDQTFSGIF